MSKSSFIHTGKAYLVPHSLHLIQLWETVPTLVMFSHYLFTVCLFMSFFVELEECSGSIAEQQLVKFSSIILPNCR